MSIINKTDIVYWLEKIFGAIGELAEVENHQSNWTEEDITKPSYIQNKPEIPAAGVIVQGTVSEGDFTPAEGAPSFSEVAALVAQSAAVAYLEYSDTYDMVVSVSDSLIKTAAGVEWATE